MILSPPVQSKVTVFITPRLHGLYQGSLTNERSQKHLIFLNLGILARILGGFTQVSSWSMYSMLAYSLKLCGFNVRALEELFAKLHGPFSYELGECGVRTWNNPTMEDHPGPSLCLFADILRMVLSIAGLETLAGFIFRLDLRIQGTSRIL
jgi:hypothetical protein